MAGPLLKSFLCFFTLKQGTMLVSILQMFISAYIIIFYLLGLSHATGMKEMIYRDSADALKREELEDVTSRHINSHRMQLARFNAHEQVYLMYRGLGLTVIHFLASFFLYYGALTSNRHLMIPWMMVMITIIATITVSLFLDYKILADCPLIAMLSKKNNSISERLFMLLLANICIYTLLTVYSTHKSLQNAQESKYGVLHHVHDLLTAESFKQASKCSRKSTKKVSLPNPYDV